MFENQARRSRLAHSITVDDYLDEECVIFEIFSCFDVIMFDKFCAAKTGVLFHPWSPQERLVLLAGVGFDAELHMLAFVWIDVLIEQEECDSVIKWPF